MKTQFIRYNGRLDIYQGGACIGWMKYDGRQTGWWLGVLANRHFKTKRAAMDFAAG